MKAKCANCNKELTQEHSDNWKMYCTEKACSKVMMDEATKAYAKPKRTKV